MKLKKKNTHEMDSKSNQLRPQLLINAAIPSTKTVGIEISKKTISKITELTSKLEQSSCSNNLEEKKNIDLDIPIPKIQLDNFDEESSSSSESLNLSKSKNSQIHSNFILKNLLF